MATIYNQDALHSSLTVRLCVLTVAYRAPFRSWFSRSLAKLLFVLVNIWDEQTT